MDQAVAFILLGFLGFLATEGTVEYLLGTAFDKVAALQPYKWGLMYVSALVGIGLVFYYGIDVIALLLGQPATPVGLLLTGVIVGRGANFVSDVWQRLFGGLGQRMGIKDVPPPGIPFGDPEFPDKE